MPKAEKPKLPPLPLERPELGDSKLQAPVDELRNVQPAYEDAVLPGGGPAGDTRWTSDQEGVAYEPGLSTPPVTPGGHTSSPTVDVVEAIPWPKGHANYQMSGVPDYSNDNLTQYKNPDGTRRYTEGSLVDELSKTESLVSELSKTAGWADESTFPIEAPKEDWETIENLLEGLNRIAAEHRTERSPLNPGLYEIPLFNEIGLGRFSVNDALDTFEGRQVVKNCPPITPITALWLEHWNYHTILGALSEEGKIIGSWEVGEDQWKKAHFPSDNPGDWERRQERNKKFEEDLLFKSKNPSKNPVDNPLKDVSFDDLPVNKDVTSSIVSELCKTAEDDERTSRELSNYIERLNNPKEQLPMHPKPWEDSPNSLGGKQKITSEENGALRMIGTMWEGPFGHWSEGDIPWAFCVPIAIAAMKRVAPEIAAEYEKTVSHVWKLYSDWWSKFDATAEDSYGAMDEEPDFMSIRLPSRAYDYYIDEDYGPQETCRVEVVDKNITSSLVSELCADLEKPMLKPRLGKAVVDLVEQMPVVTIKWEDVTFTDGAPMQTLQENRPATFWSTGFLYDEDEYGIILLMELDQDELNPFPDREPTSTYQYIPKGLIKDMKHWGTFTLDDKELPWKALGTRRAPQVKVAGLLRAGVVARIGSGVVEAEAAIAQNWSLLFNGSSVDWEQAYSFIPKVTASVEAYLEEAKANEDLFVNQIQFALRNVSMGKRVEAAGQTGENPDGTRPKSFYEFPSGNGRRDHRMPTDPQRIEQWTDQPNTAPERQAPGGGGNVTEVEIYNSSTPNTSGTDLKDSDTDNFQGGLPDSRVRLLPKDRKGDPTNGQAESGSMRLFD